MFQALAIRSEEGLKLETSVLETLFGGKFTVSLSLSVRLSVLCVYIHPITCLSICHSLCFFLLSSHPHLSFTTTLTSTFEFICWFMYLFLHL